MEEAFLVHRDKSGDKTELLGSDKFGYRSVHFVCELGTNRTALPEFARHRGVVFEIQVRTILQHAWAEIEHDRKYKFVGVLPPALERRLNIVAGILENADRELDAIAKEADAISKVDAKATITLSIGIVLTSDNIRRVVELCASENGYKLIAGWDMLDSRMATYVTEELNRFGITGSQGLEELLSTTFWATRSSFHQMTWAAITRDGMTWSDLHRYFETAWQKHWTSAAP